MVAYYNEPDPFAAQWLRNLIAAGHIAPGVVDERDIRDVLAIDLDGYTQCHFFAGIGIWSLALRNAGWPDDRPIWTGSCPCQPFSNIGLRQGVEDERHLWPVWHRLIEECRPAVVVGEQVASKDGLGWWDIVSADLEGSGYAAAAFDLSAAGFEGFHVRQRLYLCGLDNADNPRLEGHAGDVAVSDQPGRDAPLASGPATEAGSYHWHMGQDGKLRAVEPGIAPMAPAHPAHMGLLRAYGNALDAETATNFVRSVMECC
jgi:DNA (cytosine-5)-methyltransferase 1